MFCKAIRKKVKEETDLTHHIVYYLCQGLCWPLHIWDIKLPSVSGLEEITQRQVIMSD